MVSIGKIVKSESHYRYYGQIYKIRETENPPEPTDYLLGTFVKIQLDKDYSVYGIIIDTILDNPEYGKYGPRLTPSEDTEKYYPDYVEETATLVSILTIGSENNGKIFHGVPYRSIRLNDEINTIDEAEIKRFHLNQNKEFYWGYFSLLREISSVSGASIVNKLCSTLIELFPEKEDVINVLRQTYFWKRQREVLL